VQQTHTVEEGEEVLHALLHAHMDIWTYTHTLMHACMHAHTHARMHSYTHTLMHACTHTLMHSCTHTLMHSCTPALIHPSQTNTTPLYHHCRRRGGPSILPQYGASSLSRAGSPCTVGGSKGSQIAQLAQLAQ
jgi:hypothetical protein